MIELSVIQDLHVMGIVLYSVNSMALVYRKAVPMDTLYYMSLDRSGKFGN